MHPTIFEYLVRAERLQIEQKARNYWKRNGLKGNQSGSASRAKVTDQSASVKLMRRGKA